jgi:phosphate acetyltransferase
MMVYKGHADGMVSGAAHTTQHTIYQHYNLQKTKPNLWFLRSFMCLEDRVSVFGDCAQSKLRAEQWKFLQADSSLAFGIEPK